MDVGESLGRMGRLGRLAANTELYNYLVAATNGSGTGWQGSGAPLTWYCIGSLSSFYINIHKFVVSPLFLPLAG